MDDMTNRARQSRDVDVLEAGPSELNATANGFSESSILGSESSVHQTKLLFKKQPIVPP